MKKNIQKLALKDFARLFGASIKDIPSDCAALISKYDFRYRKLMPEERDSVILEVLKKIDLSQFSVAGRKKQPLWKKGWQDILNNFIKSGYDPEKLKPHYDTKPARFIRLDKDYVSPVDPMFEMKWLEIFRLWLFKKYLKNADNIFEFGCGTGQNLVVLAKIFPKKNLYGLEWVPAPLKIIKLLSTKRDMNVQGRLFDIFNPDETLNLPPQSAVLTRAALEQVGSDFNKFLNLILKKKPVLCIHSEPTLELYDENNLTDYLAAKFQRKRNYLDGFLNSLYEFEKKGKVEIIKVHRVPFGSLHLDPYSYIVWRPKSKNKN